MASRQRSPRRRWRRGRSRRGIVLLIVLSLLVMFILMAVTFIIISGQYLSRAKEFARHDLTGDDPREEIDNVFYQVVRDVRRPSRSSLKFHSLLGDLYGENDAVLGQVTGVVNIGATGGQFVRVQFLLIAGHLSDDYNGAVLTMLDGEASHLSTRIVDSDLSNLDDLGGLVPPTDGWVHVEAFESDRRSNVGPAVGDRFLINGRAFNGTGAGYSTVTQNLDRQFLGVDVALMPHFVAYIDVPVIPIQPNRGGGDESYDAVDFQNMFLAMIRRDTGGGRTVIPSFHRPSLVNYHRETQKLRPPADDLWVNNKGFRRTVVMRPMPWDHSNFTGSNPAFAIVGTQYVRADDLVPLTDALIDGPWDVDNDGDGTPESIWIDYGAAVKTSPDGRRYKPLAAILILDLDGRLNVTAAGNLQQAEPEYTADVPGPFAGGITPLALPRGQGIGPADIYLRHFIGTPSDYRQFLESRYGADNRPGVAVQEDVLSTLKSQGMPNDYSTTLSAFASPPDVWGRDAVAVDYRGQPITAFANVAVPPGVGQRVDDPYELDLSRRGANDTPGKDSPYTIAELERLLRWNDFDAAALPNRLIRVGNFAFDGPLAVQQRKRQLVTTDSRHVPTPNLIVPAELRSLGLDPWSHISAVYAARLLSGTVPLARVPDHLRTMLPWEFRKGQLFDVNRLWNNGVDDNTPGTFGAGTVDNPFEAVLAAPNNEKIWITPTGGIPTQFTGINFNYKNALAVGVVPADPVISSNRFARQIYARHLYCLMMLLVDEGYEFDLNEAGLPSPLPGTSETPESELTARRIAQWAVNVVDFRDSDSIMTAFEYDVNPFNGWQDGLLPDGTPGGPEKIDGNPDTVETGERRIVWGAEYPDLLLTETKALHDRRVKDTDYDTTGKTVGSMAGDDDDVDQFRIPQGSLFIELYCPRNSTANNPRLPAELYLPNGRLDLARLSPATGGGLTLPVWRIAISEQTYGTAKAGNSPRSRLGPRPDSTSYHPPNMNRLPGINEPLDVDRVVWFAPLDPTGYPLQNRIFQNNLGWDVSLLPGQYAVVGPRTSTAFGSIDDGDPTTSVPSDQQINLKTLNRSDPSDTGVSVTNTAGASISPTVGSQIKSVVGIVADAAPPLGWVNQSRRIGLNISEPRPQVAIYYPEPNPTNDTRQPPDAYDDPLLPTQTLPDDPFDGLPNRPLQLYNMLRTQTYPDVRTAFLQRLADPTRPWHSRINPYITIDWAAIDLTVFSGEENTNRLVGTPPTMEIDPDDPAADPPIARPLRLRTRQRGNGGNLWSPATSFPAVNCSVPPILIPGGPYLPCDLNSTLGFLNAAFGVPLTAPPAYIGDPAFPFPWLTWNNRPFASPLELMMVPSSSPSRLLSEFSLSPLAPDHYDPDPLNYDVPYGHLLNFFQSPQLPAVGSTPGVHFSQLFDLVETPSPFVGTEKWYNPTVFDSAPEAFMNGFRPPFNKLSRFRDPGRVNINTVFDRLGWRGVAKGFPDMDTAAFWDRVVRSRQGYAGAGLYRVDPLFPFPSMFDNPFRSAASADLAPDIRDPIDPTIRLLRKTGVEATLLRSDPTAPTSPLFDFTSVGEHNNTQRNAFFRYQGLTRLGNLLSTHSNVFAVWITIGYFEVEPNVSPAGVPVGIDAGHPDGWSLGQEVGLDSGQVKRHRAFFVVDRSIPVAYQPGENHNVDRAVVLRRFIE